jgi:hypothetical protein
LASRTQLESEDNVSGNDRYTDDDDDAKGEMSVAGDLSDSDKPFDSLGSDDGIDPEHADKSSDVESINGSTFNSNSVELMADVVVSNRICRKL